MELILLTLSAYFEIMRGKTTKRCREGIARRGGTAVQTKLTRELVFCSATNGKINLRLLVNLGLGTILVKTRGTYWSILIYYCQPANSSINNICTVTYFVRDLLMPASEARPPTSQATRSMHSSDWRMALYMSCTLSTMLASGLASAGGKMLILETHAVVLSTI